MPRFDFTLRFVKDSDLLQSLAEKLTTLSAFALDIETIDWWNSNRERIALIQIAYRTENQIKIVIVDALAILNLELLRLPFEQSTILKIVHNAGFDAVRLRKHYNFNLNPVFDTMTAARRNGERKYSLKAQAQVHLNLQLDKSGQNSDWSRRPLDTKQLHYAALDPFAALLLYENQTKRGLTNNYRLKLPVDSTQNLLPLDSPTAKVEAQLPEVKNLQKNEQTCSSSELMETTAALLGIIAELPNRYSPASLAVSVGSDRVGLAGWIIDKRIGAEAEPDEETVKMAIAELSEKKFVEITETRRLVATESGTELWERLKSK